MKAAAGILRRWSGYLVMAAACLPVLFGAEETNYFTARVEPILVEHCYKCHSARAEKIKGGLLLDTREGVLRGGDTGPALVPGDPDNSKIVIAVRHTDPDLQMPPKEKLSEAQIAIFELWVKTGAPDPRSAAPGYRQVKDLWSVKPLAKVVPPQLKQARPGLDPIDLFLRAERERRGLQAVPPADRLSLLRRASFDLTGLPPTSEEIDRFKNDSSEHAFAAVVDRLLDSPHFGERWGRHWLDLARYSDSNGQDQNLPYPNAFRYRDWVVNAFNQDLPYNEFIREQLAGDLLPARDETERRSHWIATGFLMLGPKNVFEPNREKLLMDIADEQIDVTSRAFLGLTVSCARCHDHKFDPIPTRDYYALAGIFRSTQTLANDARRNPNGNFFSERPLGDDAAAAAYEGYQKKLTDLQNTLNRARQKVRETPGGIDSRQLDGIVIDNLEAEVVGGWKLSNYSTNFVDKNYLHDGNDKKAKGKALVRFRPDVPQEGLYEIRLAYTARPNRATNVPVRVQGKLAPRTVFLNQTVEPKYDKAFETLGFFELLKGTNNTVEVLTDRTKGFVVVDAVQFLPQEVQLAAMLRKKRPEPEPEENMMMADVSGANLIDVEAKIGGEISALASNAPPPLPMAMAVRDGEIRNSKLLVRGDLERAAGEVPRGFLSLIQHVETATLKTDSSGRLELANWIASEQNPVTARVMVNRLWQNLFGRGLVGTPDNFGSMGERPSHPELLDYLASEFMAGGWSTKKMIRRLMLTEAYRSSTEQNEISHAKDPENRYLWQMNRRRLDAESLRDAILAANGSLDLSVGETETNAITRATMNTDDAARQSRRRSLYLPVIRGNLNDFYQAFDFPDPNALSGKRYVTTAPTQALFLMNSPFIIEQARTWADRLVEKSDSDSIERAWLAAYSRPCRPDELQRTLTFLQNYSASLAQIEPDATARRHKAWQAVCQAIFESTEFRFLN